MVRKGRRRRGADREDPEGERSSDEAQEKRGSAFVEGIKSIAIGAVLFLVMRAFLVQTFVITSGSMEETLLVGDFLVVNRAVLGSEIPFTDARIPGYGEPERFDVIVFDPPHEAELKLVKRLVGMPGDTLLMEDRVLYINGEPQEELYAVHRGVGDEPHPWMEWQREHLLAGVDRVAYRPTRDNWGPLVVPEGHYFMLGDNREASFDSRYWGLLERWRLEGRASFMYFSYDRESFKPFPWLREVRWGRIGQGIR